MFSLCSQACYRITAHMLMQQWRQQQQRQQPAPPPISSPPRPASSTTHPSIHSPVLPPSPASLPWGSLTFTQAPGKGQPPLVASPHRPRHKLHCAKAKSQPTGLESHRAEVDTLHTATPQALQLQFLKNKLSKNSLSLFFATGLLRPQSCCSC